ncbi:MAG: hypothetical protein FWH43_02110 [Endomicrobia bacterium]|nr:hypothetical protein [Endomicrobiia bacterium]
MNFSDEQILYIGRDAVEIPVVNKTAAQITYYAIITLPIIAIFLFIDKWFFKSGIGIWPIYILAVFIFGGIFLNKSIIFLLCGKKKVIFEFNSENFIYNGKAVKWADMQKISYGEFPNGKNNLYHIKIYYKGLAEEKIVKDILKKEGSSKIIAKEPHHMEIINDIVLKISSKKMTKLIADKFYQYYGALHGVMLKENFFFKKYELKSVSGQNIGQKNPAKSADSEIQLPKLFK